ncbi:TetR/AcrR family transcriptional regulator [Corynebacterium sp. LK2510]|uniref:TetR/AcrR family transcriptional regulator n=1 Tax=Corynebacterium sp. LK2510 TaxID=3110472 RepID=UPI0034CD99B7
MIRRGDSTDPRALRTRAQLIDAARDLLQNNSSEDLSVSGIVKAAGVSRQAFYEHFTSRESLLLAVAEPVLFEPLVNCISTFRSGSGDGTLISGCVDAIAENREVVLNLLSGPAGALIYDQCRQAMVPVTREVIQERVGARGKEVAEDALGWTTDFVIAGALGVLVSVLRNSESGEIASQRFCAVARTLDMCDEA